MIEDSVSVVMDYMLKVGDHPFRFLMEDVLVLLQQLWLAVSFLVCSFPLL